MTTLHERRRNPGRVLCPALAGDGALPSLRQAGAHPTSLRPPAARWRSMERSHQPLGVCLAVVLEQKDSFYFFTLRKDQSDLPEIHSPFNKALLQTFVDL